MKKRNNLILSILGIGVFAYVIYAAGFEEVLDTLSQTSIKYLLVVFIIFSVAQFTRTEKWMIMCRVMSLKTQRASLIKFYFHTRLMGLVTPFRSGEVVPSFFEDRDKDKFFSLTVADRFYESLTTIIVITAALFFLFSDLFDRNAWFVIGVMIAALALFYLIFSVESFYVFFKSVIQYPGKNSSKKSFRKRFIVFLDDVYLSISKALGVKVSLILFLITMAATLIDVLMFKYLFMAVGIDIGYADSAVAFSFLSLINFVSPTPSGVGIGDAGYLALATRLEIGSQAQIGSFLVLTRVYIVALALLYALIFHAVKKAAK